MALPQDLRLQHSPSAAELATEEEVFASNTG
jgi:hypothetical protein